MKIVPVNNLNKSNLTKSKKISTSFCGKIPEVPVSEVSELAIKTAGAAVAAMGAAFAMIGKGVENKKFFEEPEVKACISEHLKPYLNRDMYSVVREYSKDSPGKMDEYLKRKIKTIVIDSKPLSKEMTGYFGEIAKNIIFERLSNKSLPEDLSDISQKQAKSAYSKIVFSKKLLEYCKKNDITLEKLAILTGLTPRQTVSAARGAGVMPVKYDAKFPVDVKTDLPDITIDKLKECLEQGLSGHQMSDFFGCPQRTLYKKLQEYNLATICQKQRRNNAAISDSMIIEAYNAGLRPVEIAEKFNCSFSYIYLRLKNLNLTHKFKSRSRDEILEGDKKEFFDTEVFKLVKEKVKQNLPITKFDENENISKEVLNFYTLMAFVSANVNSIEDVSLLNELCNLIVKFKKGKVTIHEITVSPTVQKLSRKLAAMFDTAGY